MKYTTIPFVLIVEGCLVLSCIDPFAPKVLSENKSYLVVNGFLSTGDSSCTISLGRTQPIYSLDSLPTENGATVRIEDMESGTGFTLTPKAHGVYSGTGLELSKDKQYRLHLTTAGNQEYVSDYVPLMQTTPIDSVGWYPASDGTARNGIKIYVTTHDFVNNNQYYLWTYDETWEYTAAYEETLIYQNGKVIPNPVNNFYCWKTVSSVPILVASTEGLQQNIVSQFILEFLPAESVKLQKGYSLLVKQQAITKDAFQYWQQLKANTENLGTIFGPLPSQFSGNIHSVSIPSEPVLGFFSATSVQQKRIFLKPEDLPAPQRAVVTGYETCELDYVGVGDFLKFGSGEAIVSSIGLGPTEYVLTSFNCADCRLQGGTIVEPDFWPN
jgi:Domain of unknown function (DUF4249)